MNNHNEMKKIKSVILAYTDGTFAADIEKLKGAFHPDAVMNGYLGDNLVLATPSVFFEDLASAPSMKDQNDPYNPEIESIMIDGNIASVILSETGFKGDGKLINCFHLIKIADDWKIVSKLFTTLG